MLAQRTAWRLFILREPTRLAKCSGGRHATKLHLDRRLFIKPVSYNLFSTSKGTKTSDQASNLSLPDKEREKEISRIQVEVQDRYRSGNYSRALVVVKDLVKESEDHFGRNHPATASAYNNLGLIQKQLGSFDEARESYRIAQKIYKATVGPDHSSYASILHNLGNLNRSQIHFDDTLKATDRLTLIEQATEYLEKAYSIRVLEMGADHPHTVASRSSWGSTIATQILHHHKMSTATSGKQRPYISLLSKEVTEQGWQAAETHLREALRTAIEKPRGPGTKKGKSAKGGGQGDNDRTPQTLSAASAAQNLAVFLKTRATTETPYNEAWLAEAKYLYDQTLAVRSKLLPQEHPDLYATKFSLAELLETMGQKEAANVIRQEIVDTYDPPTKDSANADKPAETATAK